MYIYIATLSSFVIYLTCDILVKYKSTLPLQILVNMWHNFRKFFFLNKCIHVQLEHLRIFTCLPRKYLYMFSKLYIIIIVRGGNIRVFVDQLMIIASTFILIVSTDVSFSFPQWCNFSPFTNAFYFINNTSTKYSFRYHVFTVHWLLNSYRDFLLSD